jgi:hypothetical protein
VPISSVGCWFFENYFDFPINSGYYSQTVYFTVQFHLFILSLGCWVFLVVFRKMFPMPICSSAFPTTCWSCFLVSGLILRLSIYFKLILVQGKRKGYSFSLLHLDIQFSHQYLLQRLSISSCVLVSFVKDQLFVLNRFISGFSILIHWFLGLFLCQYHTAFIVLAL